MFDAGDVVAPEWNQGAESEEDLAPDDVGAEVSTEDLAPDASADDAIDWQAEAREAQEAAEKLQTDLNNMKRQYDRQMFQQQQQFEQQIQQYDERLSEFEMRDMSDEDKAEYLRQRELQRLERQASQLEQREMQLTQRESALAWQDFFVNRIGLDPDEVTIEGSFDDFYASSWAATEGLVSDLRSRNEQLEQFIAANDLQVPGQPAQQRPSGQRRQVGKTPPKVQTREPGEPPGKKRMADVPVTDREAMFQAFERGEISADDLPV